MSEFSDYIVFVDESGSPTMSAIDPNHPVFVLVFCIINKWTYCDIIQPAIKRLKFEFFGHDMVVLRSSDIRKRRGEFSVLMREDIRRAFLARLDNVIEAADVSVITAVIDKPALVTTEFNAHDPYHLALDLCLLSLKRFLDFNDKENRLTHVIAESRGKTEDSDLRLAFNRSIAWLTGNLSPLNVDLKFAQKKMNSAGLQLADLFGHPIGRNAINPAQPNHAFELVRRKIFEQVERFPPP